MGRLIFISSSCFYVNLICGLDYIDWILWLDLILGGFLRATTSSRPLHKVTVRPKRKSTMGRQPQQQGNEATQHPYSENRGDAQGDPMYGKWLQSTGHQHQHFSSANLQDCTNYGGVQSMDNADRARMCKTRSVNASTDFISEPSTPPVVSRTSSQKNVEGCMSPGDLSPGIFDLHSVDSELLSEVSISGFNDSGSPMFPIFENESDVLAYANKQQANRLRPPSDNNQVRVVSMEREKATAGAKIKVVVRKRPLNRKEVSKKEEDIVSIEPSCAALTVHETKLKVDLTAYVEKHEFVFDAVLNDQVSNDEVYRVTVEPIVPAIFHRTKATCFAYGQTGSGKTYTMQPLPLKASNDILRLMQHHYRNEGFQLYVSFFEIYGGKLFDLLSDRRKLCMREDAKQQVCIVGLQEFRVFDVGTVKEFIEKGNATRSTGSTGANEESSRSHAILQLVVKKLVDESKPPRFVGKLSFIDLAGSERGADTTDNDRQTRMEGAEINKSLLALKECIRALDNDQVHIPFRGSKLTEVLRDSFVGDSRTVMISCISPNSGSCEHTLNTLRYADRVKSLSKAGNSKKDPVPSVTLRESSTAPLALPLSSMPSYSTPEKSNSLGNTSDANRFGWNKQSNAENHQQFTMDHAPPVGRDDTRMASVYADIRENRNNFLVNRIAQESQEQDKQVHLQSLCKGKPERYQNQNSKEEVTNLNNNGAIGRWQAESSGTVHTRFKSKDAMDSDMDITDPEEEFDAILKEEEDLLSAHRKEVEESINIMKEEMRLLTEAEKPGSHIDAYVSQLSVILTQKKNAVLNLQSRLARFTRLLNDQNILNCPPGVRHA